MTSQAWRKILVLVSLLVPLALSGLLVRFEGAQAQTTPDAWWLQDIEWRWAVGDILVGYGSTVVIQESSRANATVKLTLPESIISGQPFTTAFEIAVVNPLLDVYIQQACGRDGTNIDYYDIPEGGLPKISIKKDLQPVADGVWSGTGTAYPQFEDGTTVQTNCGGYSYPYFRVRFENISRGDLEATPHWRKVEGPVVTGLDNRYVARNTPITITLRGMNLSADAVPQFLKADGTVDTNIEVNPNTIKVTPDGKRLTADVFIKPDAELGLRDVKLKIGGTESPVLPRALTVIDVRLEINQGAVTSLATDRVANHPTVVRVFVDSAVPIPNLTGRLYVFDGGEQIAGSPFQAISPPPPGRLQSTLSVKTSYTNEDQYYLRNSLNFYFGDPAQFAHGYLPAKNLQFFVAISAEDPASLPPKLNNFLIDQLRARRDFILLEEPVIQNFKTTKNLRVYAIVDPRLEPRLANQMFAAHNNTSWLYLRAAYPVDARQVRFERFPTTRAELDIDDMKCFMGWNWGCDCWANRIMRQMVRILKGVNHPAQRFDRVVLFVTLPVLKGILGDDNVPGISDKRQAAIVSEGAITTLAHELGHTYELGDTYEGGTSTRINPRKPNAPANGNPVEDGMVRLAPVWNEFVLGEPRPIVGAAATVNADGIPLRGALYRWVSLMGASNHGINNIWPDMVEWTHLWRQFRPATPLAAPQQTAADIDLLTVGGLVTPVSK